MSTRRTGLEAVLITGDDRRTARATARRTGTDGAGGWVLPAPRESEVTRLQANGRRAPFVSAEPPCVGSR